MTRSRTYLLVGHVTKDLLPDQGFTIGGTVTYASVVARNLGWQPRIITPAGVDFVPPAYLADLEWCILPSPETLTFRNLYDAHGSRTQIIGPFSSPVTAADISAACAEADLVHLCPLAPNIAPDIVTAFAGARLVSTPQGWLRRWDERGVVSLGDWLGAAEILPKLRAAVISIEDVEGNWHMAESWAARTSILVVTQGELGCTVIAGGEHLQVPPRPAQPIDPTGAGDVFAAAFFICLEETGDVWQAARFANVTASMAIERHGPEGAPDRSEIETYLQQHQVEPFA